LENEINEKCNVSKLEELEEFLSKELKEFALSTNERLKRAANKDWVNMMLKKLDEIPKNEIKLEDSMFTRVSCGSCGQKVNNLKGTKDEFVPHSKFPSRMNNYSRG